MIKKILALVFLLIIVSLVGYIIFIKENAAELPATIFSGGDKTVVNMVDDRAVEEIFISGATSGMSILEPIAIAFEKKYPKYKVNFFSIGPSTGKALEPLSRGMLDIGVSARLLTPEEANKFPDIKQINFLKDAVVFGVNHSVDIANITKNQVIKIATGEYKNWNELGGNDLPIIFLDREEYGSSKILLREKILGDLKITDGAVLMSISDGMNRAIQETTGAIGYTSLGQITKGLNIKVVSLEGIMPNVESVSNDRYEMIRVFGLMFPNRGENLPERVVLFSNFVFSEDARQIFEPDFVFISGNKVE